MNSNLGIGLFQKFHDDSDDQEEDEDRFTCRICGNLELRNGEFETIKLGDIFTSVTQYSRKEPEQRGDPANKLCGRCVAHHKKENIVVGIGITEHHENKKDRDKENEEKNDDHLINSIITNNVNVNIKMEPELETDKDEDEDGDKLFEQEQDQQQDTIPSLINKNNSQEDSNFMLHQPNASLLLSTNTSETNYSSPSSMDSTSVKNENSSLTASTNVNNMDIDDTPTTITFVKDTKYSITLPVPNIDDDQFQISSTPLPSQILPTAETETKSKPIATSSSLDESIASVASCTDSVLPRDYYKFGDVSTSNGNQVYSTSKFEEDISIPDIGIGPTTKICPICNKSFKSHKIALAHFQRVHEKLGKYCCEICGLVFSYRGSLVSHLASHNTPDITFNCTTCGQRFKEKSNLNAHMQIHLANSKKHKCEYCESAFSKRVNLRGHMKRKHPEAETLNNNNTMTTNSTNIPSQMNLSDGGDADPNQSFSNNKSQGQFKCEECGKPFLFKNNLKAHLRTHTREKKYSCNLCDKSFIYKESLKNHGLLHSQEMPYECDLCGKKFRDRSNRRKHVKNVHKYMFLNGESNCALPTAANLNECDIKPTTQLTETLVKKPKKKKPKNQGQVDGSSGSTAQNSSSKTSNIKSNKNKKSKTISTIDNNYLSTPSNTNNNLSVIVNNTILNSDLDRKIIMSPSPKIGFIQSPSTLGRGGYIATAATQQQISSSLSRNIIVKAESSSPPIYYAQQQHSMQQNVIVYPKSKTEYSHQSQGSVISSSQGLVHQQFYNASSQQQQEYQEEGVAFIPQSVSNLAPPINQQQQQQRISPHTYEYHATIVDPNAEGIPQLIHRLEQRGEEAPYPMQVIEVQDPSGMYSQQYWTYSTENSEITSSAIQQQQQQLQTTYANINPNPSPIVTTTSSNALTINTNSGGAGGGGGGGGSSEFSNDPTSAATYYKDLAQFDFSYLGGEN